MLQKTNVVYVLFTLILMSGIIGCKNKHAAVKKEIVKVPEEMDDQITENIKAVLQFAHDNNGKINDSSKLYLFNVVNSFYDNNNYHNIWSRKEKWMPLADSMFDFIEHSKYYGLYPRDYHFNELTALRKKIIEDTLAKKDAIVWTKADLLLSDAFMKTLRDLKEGRLLPETLSITRKPKYIDSFFIKNLTEARNIASLTNLFNSVEPANFRYQSLKNLVKDFVDNMDTTRYQFIVYPQKDSFLLIKNLQKRLVQSGLAKPLDTLPDSVLLSKEIKKYQSANKLRKDGKFGPKLIESLNNFDQEKFRRIAITLDRYKLMPDTLPLRYVWVNLPSYFLELWDNDTLIIRSKVIIGKPETRTPVLTSAITDMVTYPQWTIPESIIKKDILPALKKDPGYLAAKGFNLVDSKGDIVDPYTIKWSKYSKGIPWKIMQGSGDDNALGVLKFNFNNPYSVYLHDTNQRYLFQNSDRGLSHGCVRVQKWEQLAFYIARNDSLNTTKEQKLAYDVDSIKKWLSNRDRKRIFIKNRLPLFIEYFSCEARDDKLVIYKDIYNDDAMLAEKYFANK
ncbi:L,D-transpeptidase family protein [Ginsengibacter hankyongi]|uniref:L,D-transpeptidase family protein n=1 Tax=Ginsengibacter hankyongi TaxID=2607284 RepID=A0A5J5IMN4_9BACT|nr:L,D-transpeptidase family protein [Ginsengibacter hankyongi]KAA9041164.1 L,D-transpeptidase family protein [Ginsengibacter hankyongi]